MNKATEKSVSRKTSVSSDGGEKSSTTSAATKATKQKPVVETVKKYSTRRTTQLDEAKCVELKPQTKSSASSPQEKTLIQDTKTSPSKNSKLQPLNHKEKSKVKPPPLSIKISKQNKSPSKTPTKSPSKTTPVRSPSTRQPAKQKSPHKSTSATSRTTRSHTKTTAKATASTSDPIPVWLTWKCCLCSCGSSQDHLGFLYGPYKSQTDDSVSVGSKRTHDDTENESSDEKLVPELWVHEGCACWAPGVCLVGTELHGLAEAVKNAKDMVCYEMYNSM